jgi:hypothetical protein
MKSMNASEALPVKPRPFRPVVLFALPNVRDAPGCTIAHPQPPEEGVRSESDDWISGDAGNGQGGRLFGGAVCSIRLITSTSSN